MPLPTHLEKEIYDSIATDGTLTHTERQLFVKWYSMVASEDGTATSSDNQGSTSTSSAAFKGIQYQLKQDYR